MRKNIKNDDEEESDGEKEETGCTVEEVKEDEPVTKTPPVVMGDPEPSLAEQAVQITTMINTMADNDNQHCSNLEELD